MVACVPREEEGDSGESCVLKSTEGNDLKKVVWLSVPNVINRSSKSCPRTDH